MYILLYQIVSVRLFTFFHKTTGTVCHPGDTTDVPFLCSTELDKDYGTGGLPRVESRDPVYSVYKSWLWSTRSRTGDTPTLSVPVVLGCLCP